MAFSADIDRFMRGIALAVVVATGVAFLPGTANVFQLPKATVVVLGGLILLGAAAVRVASQRSAVGQSLRGLPRRPLTWILGVFAVALVASSLLASDVPEAIVGDFGRYAGLATYLSYVVFFLASATVIRGTHVTSLLQAVLVSALLVAAYGLVQQLGIDPVEYQTFDLPGVFSTMGNPNFASAYVGLAVSVAISFLFAFSRSGRMALWWWLSVAHVVLALVVMAATGSVQGPLVAAAGGFVVVAVAVSQRSPSFQAWTEARMGSRRARQFVAAGLLLVVALAFPALWLAVGRLGGSRVYAYDVAVRLLSDNPWLGIGLGSFADHFLLMRAPEHARLYANLTADTAHSVPLELFVGGGVFVGAAYLAFVMFVGWRLLVGIWSLEGPSQLLVAGLGGVWLAYQVQSLISIDVPALGLVHWVTAGAIVGLTAPGDVAGSSRRGHRRRVGGRGSKAAPTPALLLAALLVVGSVPLVIRPLRADLAAARGVQRFNEGAFEESREAFDRSHELFRWESTYYFLEARALEGMGQQQAALEALVTAAELEPGNAQYALMAARLADVVGDTELAVQWYREAAARDPVHVATLLQVASALQEHGETAAARDLYLRVLELEPGNAQASSALETLSGF